MSATKTALVTGANKGIGKEIVRQLAAKGYKVFLGARDEQRGKEAVAELNKAGLKDVHFLMIDVTSDESVKAAAATLASQVSALDVLVNNAGILLGGGKGINESMDEVKTTFEVNVYGVIRTTQAFVELLKKSTAGRVVNLSSALGSLGITSNKDHPFYPMIYISYNASKSALNAVTIGFAKALAEFKIKVNSADPGYTATDLNGNSGPQSVEVGAQSSVFLATLPDDGPTASFYDKDGVVVW